MQAYGGPGYGQGAPQQGPAQQFMSQGGYQPQQTGRYPSYAPQATGYGMQGGGMYQQQQQQQPPMGMAPQQQGYMPQQTGYVPQQTGYMPQQTGYMQPPPPQQPQQGYVPQYTGYVPQQTGMMMGQQYGPRQQFPTPGGMYPQQGEYID